MSKATMHSQADFHAWAGKLEPKRRQQEAHVLDQLFRKSSGYAPALWPGGIIGYGSYDYTYASGRSGTSLATGFAPRKAKLSIYIMPGYADFDDILERLGKHKKAMSCVYINKLDDVNLDVLAELVCAGLRDLERHWPVVAS
ncbi:MAG: DUF1801 domain-containing protein [Paracoccaceae bacterium]